MGNDMGDAEELVEMMPGDDEIVGPEDESGNMGEAAMETPPDEWGYDGSTTEEAAINT